MLSFGAANQNKTHFWHNFLIISMHRFDGRMDAPMRKTATAFRQPVTLVHTTSRRLHSKGAGGMSNAEQKQLQANSAATTEKADKGRQVWRGEGSKRKFDQKSGKLRIKFFL